MKKNNKEKVIFRIDKWGDVIAFFPETYKHGELVCYQHVGQHSNADIMYYLTETKKATPEQYKDLYNELTNLVGYDLRIMQRMTY